VTHADESKSVVNLLMRATSFYLYKISAPFVVSFSWASLTCIFPVNVSYQRKLIASYDTATQKLSFDFRDPNNNINRQTLFTFDAPLVTPSNDTSPLLPMTPPVWDSKVSLPAYDLTHYIHGLVWFGPTVDFATHADTTSMTIALDAANGDRCIQYLRSPQVDYAFEINQECVSRAPVACVKTYAPDPAPIGMATIFMQPSMSLLRLL
jgi:hypothetical protein